MAIKVLHIIKSLGRGGAETLLPETLRLHDKIGFEFHYIYFFSWKDQMVEAITRQGGKVTCCKAGNTISLLMKLNEVVAYVRSNQIQIIHAHLPWAGVVAKIVGKITKVPVVYTEHNKQERYHVLTRYMNLLTMPWLNRVIAVSEDVAQSVRKHKPSLRIPVQLILNGVNTEHFKPGHEGAKNIRDQFNISDKAPVIGTIAVFRSQKQLDLWMEIASQILMQEPDVHFVIVGDGPLKNELLLKREQLKVSNRVHFAGLQTEVRPYFALFDIYMMSSIFEGLPIALLEAMASGCPVISTSAGGIKEVIRHGTDGLLCPVDQSGELVNFATRLLQDVSERKKMGQQGRIRVEEAFGIGKMVRALEEVYIGEIGKC